jgi:hypothetical protein
MKQNDGHPSRAGGLIEGRETDGEIQAYVDRILEIYDDLSQRADLRPSPCINHQFEKLVELCTVTISTAATRKVCHSVLVTYADHHH